MVEPCWGQRYATEALRALLGHVLADPDVRRVVAETPVGHVASRRVMEKAGMRPSGERVGEVDGQLPPRPSGTVPPMGVEVEVVGEVTGELVEAVGRLLPQLSGSACPLGADELARVVGHQAITLLAARSQGGVVGMLTLVTFPLPSGLRARIEDVVVDQGARGRGVATALTTAALELARRRGARNVDLTSRASRVAANRLYQRLGFERRDSNVYRYHLATPAPPPAP